MQFPGAFRDLKKNARRTTDGRTNRQIDGRKDPLIEMRGRIKNCFRETESEADSNAGFRAQSKVPVFLESQKS